MASMRVFLMLSSVLLIFCAIDHCAGNPYPSIGNSNGKSKRLGNCAFYCCLIWRKKLEKVWEDVECEFLIWMLQLSSCYGVIRISCCISFGSVFLYFLQTLCDVGARFWWHSHAFWFFPQIFLEATISSVSALGTALSARKCSEVSSKGSFVVRK